MTSSIGLFSYHRPAFANWRRPRKDMDQSDNSEQGSVKSNDQCRPKSWRTIYDKSTEAMKPILDKSTEAMKPIMDKTQAANTAMWDLVVEMVPGNAKLAYEIASLDEEEPYEIPQRVELLGKCGPQCVGSFAPKSGTQRNSGHIVRPYRKPVRAASDAVAALYAPLLGWQTRILNIKAGSLEDTVAMDLQTCDLLAMKGVALSGKGLRAEYDALSYCWGETQPDARVYCNGVPITITQHLHAALRKLRKSDTDRYLWVDALCINQLDLDERAMQVKNMLTIYKKAREVLVWLGEETSATGWSVHAFHSIRVSSPSPNIALEAGITVCDDHAARMHEGLSDIFHRAWFTRVWVQQESWAAGDNLAFICGTLVLSRRDLFVAARVADLLHAATTNAGRTFSLESAGPHARTYSCIPSVGVDERFRIERDQELGRDEPIEVSTAKGGFRDGDILEVLRHASGRNCSDPRDHVYALVGMSTMAVGSEVSGSQLLPSFNIDYTISPARVFVNLAWYIVARDGWLSIFYLVRPTDRPPIAKDELLPSWCPDWRIVEVPEPFLDNSYFEALRTHSTFHRHRRLHAALRLRKLQVDAAGEKLPWRTLRLRGLCVADNMTSNSVAKVHFPSAVKAKLPWSTAMNLYVDLLAPKHARYGDSFVLFEDEPVPVCIRKVSKEIDEWHFVGICLSKTIRQAKHRSDWQAVSAICRQTGSFETFDLV